jgi:hypothetical protein
MKTFMSSLIYLFLVTGFWIVAGETRENPIAVSPESETGLDTVSQSCSILKTFYGQMDGGTEAQNTYYGIGAGSRNTTGAGNTFIGLYAGVLNTTGSGNTFQGNGVGFYNTTGTFNTFLGYWAGRSNTTAFTNTCLGYFAGVNTSTGGDNTFLGKYSGVTNATGYANTFLGRNNGLYGINTTGYINNTFLGDAAGSYNTTGSANTFLGQSAGYFNTTGNNNTSLGVAAGSNNTTGSANTFLGQSAGYSNTTGYNNTSLGYHAGFNNTTGNDNTFLGYNAGYNETGSNKLYIDNTGTSDPLIYGEFDNNIVNINGKLGIGTKTPGYPMEIVRTGVNASIVLNRTDGARNYINATATFGNFGTVNNYPLRLVVNSAPRMTLNNDNSLSMASGATCTAGGVWTNASSIALKENISALNPDEAATTLQALNPVKYNYKAEKDESHVGFIAEEVPELVAMKDRKSLSPMDIVAVLTKVKQDQQKQLQEQKQINDNLTQKMQEQKQINNNLTRMMQEQQQINQNQFQQVNEKMKMEFAELNKKLSAMN